MPADDDAARRAERIRECALLRIASLPTAAETRNAMQGIHPDTSRNGMRDARKPQHRRVIR